MMRFSLAFAVLFVAVAAVSAGVYPVKTGGGKGASKHSKGGGHDNAEDDRFHMQSADGQYVFGHTTGTQGRAEIRNKDGTVTGYYSYVGDNGKVVYVNYVADQKGYRVLSNTGVPSASVTIEGDAGTKGPRAEKDFLQVFTDFTKRIKDKVVKQAGQETVDLGDGQHQIDVIDPASVYPTKEIKSISNKETDQFPDWNRVKIPSTQKPTVSIDGIEITEGQQQQGTVDPNLDNVTTQKIKGYDNDIQGSNNYDWDGAVITTETAMKNIPSYPNQPQVPTKGDRKEEYADTTTVHEVYVQEITTEIGNSKVITESPVFTNDAENNSPISKPAESIVVNDAQTTISYYDVSGKPAEGRMINREDIQLTTMGGVRQFEESSTVAAEISESVTTNNQIVQEIQEKIKTPLETDVVLTTGKPLDKESSDNVPVVTENPSDRIDLKIADAEFTTITTAVDEKMTVNTRVNTASPAEYEPKTTTFQPDVKTSDMETTTTGIQYVTEANRDDGFDFKTLEQSDVIGTTSIPNRGQSEAQEVQDIAWPEIPAVPAVPQVLVPLNPYPENSGVKNAVVKSHSANSRLVRNFNLNVDDAKSSTVNSLEEIKTTMPTNVSMDEDHSTMFYSKYFIIG
ncbi:uncharacterized protein LOC112688168 isoform X2 [Sipha flava]|uniref:Uncharacterized protein LOC112688168 isoform X2 n=1 Tax=Sipha flava TaxID=143950 RepID=A0A8B8G2Y3_9HEMI|nr:uncharacterized protein LOC112688168 isoform X2 [Sipha flava]